MDEILPENIKIIVKTNPKDWFDDLKFRRKTRNRNGSKRSR
ncbi:hypothetical protein CLU83_3628 [Flavobacterium sp. 1]|nr:hypothetical protein [Flavobacterium sp. 1]PJJ10229.1 hypothetical protein CLU83_3628 [Flavobacterium sp. 1]